MIKKIKNLIGQRFGLGIVIEQSGMRTICKNAKYPRQFQEWKLLCDCGNEYITTTQHLEGDRTKSCGCIRRKNLTGKKFGYTTVIKYHKNDFKGINSKRTVVMWECLCDCGKTHIVNSEYLLNGDTKSCGCISSNFHCIDNNQSSNSLLSIKKYYNRLKKGAKKRGILFDITIYDITILLDKQQYRCSISNEIISLNTPITASIDRIDNNLGYISSNIHWVHRKINYMKNTMNIDDFLMMCKKVTEYNCT